jgi:uncharacterized FAD-dependent dehydrogenase
LVGIDPDVGRNAETPDIRSLLDTFHNIGSSIAAFLRDLGGRYPGILASDSKIFAPALEWDYGTLALTSTMETTISGWYAVGDGAGVSQGVVHAAASGILAARDVCLGLDSTLTS